MESLRSQKLNTVDLGGDRRSVTATYRYGSALFTLVAQTKADCDREARRRWGEWDGWPCYSSPRSIYFDLTGETKRRAETLGMYASA